MTVTVAHPDARLAVLCDRIDTALTGTAQVMILTRDELSVIAEYLATVTADLDQGRHVRGWYAQWTCGCTYLGEIQPKPLCPKHVRGERTTCEPTAFPVGARTGVLTHFEEQRAVRGQL